MFNIGDKVSHPMHGAGVIVDIVDRSINNKYQPFYLVDMVCGSMSVLIPCASCESIGVRYIIGDSEAKQIIACIPELSVESDDNWSKRYKDNLEKIKSGDLYQVAEVVKSLMLRDRIKSLSTGERKLLGMAKSILVSELVLATDGSVQDIERMVIKSIK